MKIAILGASGHVGKNLTCLFANSNQVTAFSRNHPYTSYAYLNRFDFDVIINCVGFGNPEEIKNAGIELFSVTETYDNMALEYLEKHPYTKYIFISSGVAHNKVDINHLNFYQISKINAEAKHRALPGYDIADIRLYSFFSKYIDLNSKFFMSEIIKCIRDKTEFTTNSTSIIRDYINPKDLYSLINICISKDFINDAFDIYSLREIEKFMILDYFWIEYNLKVKIKEDYKGFSSAGADSYFLKDSSLKDKTAKLGYSPKYSSLDTIMEESRFLI